MLIVIFSLYFRKRLKEKKTTKKLIKIVTSGTKDNSKKTTKMGKKSKLMKLSRRP